MLWFQATESWTLPFGFLPFWWNHLKTMYLFRQKENLVDNQKCQVGFRSLCNKILIPCGPSFHQWNPSLTDYTVGKHKLSKRCRIMMWIHPEFMIIAFQQTVTQKLVLENELAIFLVNYIQIYLSGPSGCQKSWWEQIVCAGPLWQ